MTEFWEWHFCEKCNTWTEHDSSTGGNICRRCKFVSKTIVIDLKKQREEKLIKDISEVLAHVDYIGARYRWQEANSMEREEYKQQYSNDWILLSKAIIDWVRKNK